MAEMKIEITAAELTAAINNLVSVLKGDKAAPTEKQSAPSVNPTAVHQIPTGVPLSATPAPTVAPVANPVPADVEPVQPALVTQQPYVAPATQVPTSAPTFTLEAIATAGTALVDAGKMDLLMGVLAKHGIDSITKLDPSQYGIFATELRALGAQI